VSQKWARRAPGAGGGAACLARGRVCVRAARRYARGTPPDSDSRPAPQPGGICDACGATTLLHECANPKVWDGSLRTVFCHIMHPLEETLIMPAQVGSEI
jgi:hypothetical protein